MKMYLKPKDLKKLLLFTCIFISNNSTKSQVLTFDWVRTIGDPFNQRGVAIASEAFFTYSVGNYEGTVDFDPGVGVTTLTCLGTTDGYITKFETDGDLFYAKRLGGSTPSSTVLPKAVAYSSTGEVYVTGSFSGTVDFDPGAGTVNLTATSVAEDIFVLKLDAIGSFLWVKQFGSAGTENGSGIAVDASGNVYTTGYFENTIDFDPGAGISNLVAPGSFNGDVFVLKLNSSGNFVWAKKIGGTSTEISTAIAIDASSNVITTGNFFGSTDFDPGAATVTLNAVGGQDAFISKLDLNGNYIWAKQIGSLTNETSNELAVDAAGNIHIAGYFDGTTDFDPGAATVNLTTIGGVDAFVVKFDASGNFNYAKQIGSIYNEQARGLAIDATGNVYCVGSFENTIDINTDALVENVSPVGGADVFILKLDALGNYVTGVAFGGIEYDFGESISVNSSGWVFTTGYFDGTVDFNTGVGVTNITTAGYADVFIHKLKPCTIPAAPTSSNDTICGGSTSTLTATGGSSISWYDAATGGIFLGAGSIYTTPVLTSTNTYYVQDSTCTSSNRTPVLVMVNPMPDINVSVSSLTISSNQTAALYQWLNCDSGLIPIASETSQAYTVTSNGNYAVEINLGGCIDTSACTLITGIGMNDENELANIHVYPNPTKDNIQLELNIPLQKIEVVLKNVMGQIIFSRELMSQRQILIEINSEPGIYFLETILNNGNTQVIKIIKN
jgi:hypothetical protein